MADARVTRGAVPARWIRMHPLLRVGIVYLAARVVTTVLFVAASAASEPTSRFGENPSLADFVLGWDAQWYWMVAVNAYPSQLPLTDAGQVAENAWAFMPVYAFVSILAGAGNFGLGAFLVSFVAGFAACVALRSLLRERAGESQSMWAVAFFASGPLAALFQVGYGESLFVMLLLLALLCVARRRWGWLYLLIPLMGYTRPGVLAFALFLGLYGIWRWWRRSHDALPVTQIVHIVSLGALATIVGFSWQVLATVVTGDPDAYLQTELAWRRSWIGGEADGFVPFEGWLQAAAAWSRVWGIDPTLGYLLLGLLVAATAGSLLFVPAVRRAGAETRLWAVSYIVYLLAVFFPQSSTFRLLLPLTPLWGAVAAPRSLLYRVSVLLACIAGQWCWIWNMYAMGDTFWRIP